MSSSFGCILHLWISLQLILSSLYIDHTLSIVQYTFDDCSFEFKKKCDISKCSLNEIANITWNVDQRRTRKEEQPTARNFLMVESQDAIHYPTSHKETFRKLNDTLWNSFCRNDNINWDEYCSINVHEIDVKIMHCVVEGLNFYLLTICHKLEIVQINAKNIFRSKLNTIISGVVMICNCINCNCSQQCTIISNIMLLKKNNLTQELHLVYNSCKNQKSQLKVKQLRSLKAILKFLSSQFNLNFEGGNSKSVVLSQANFSISSSRRRDSNNSFYNQSATWCENVFKFLKRLKNSIVIYKYNNIMVNRNESVSNITYNVQSRIETRKIEINESREGNHFNATEMEILEPLRCNKQTVKDKIDTIKELQISNNNAWSTDDIGVQSENINRNKIFKKRLLLSIRKKRRLNSKNHQKRHKKLPFKSKELKSKRHIRSTSDLLFNGRKKSHSLSNPIPTNAVLTRHINEDIDLKSLPSSSAKNSANTLLSSGSRESQKRPGRQIEEVFGEIADALRAEKITEEEGRLEDSREAAASAFFSGRSRRPSRITKNNRRSVSRPRRSLIKMPAGQIDGKAAKIITASGDCEERSRRQRAIRGEPVRKSADSDKLEANSQDEPPSQSDIVIGERNDEITSGKATDEALSGPEKLILKLTIAKDSKDNLKGDSLLLAALCKSISKNGKFPKSVRIEIIGPTKKKERHEKREILPSNNYPQDSPANDKSFYDDGMELEEELKELPKLPFKSRLNKLRNRRKFGKLRSNLREEESNAGADSDVTKLVDPVQPNRNYPSDFLSRENIARDSVSSNKNFLINHKKEEIRNNHKIEESEKVPDKESSVYYYDYYDYENSGNNFNRHKSNDLRARQVGRKLLSLNSMEPDEDISLPDKKSNSSSNEKFYGDQQSKKVVGGLHYSPMESRSSLCLETSEVTEEPSASKLIRCTFNKSIAQFLSGKNIGEVDTRQEVRRKNNAEIGFLKRNLKSISPARKSSLSENDPLRQVFVSGDFEESNPESNEKQANARLERGSDEEDDSIRDLYKLFGRDYELKLKGKLHLHFPESKSKKKSTKDSSRRKRCSGPKRPKGRRKRLRRRRKFTNGFPFKDRQNYFGYGNDDSPTNAVSDKTKQTLADVKEGSKSALEKITNFFKKNFGGEARKKIKAKIIKVIPGKSGGETGEIGDRGKPAALQGNEGSCCKCSNSQTTPAAPEVVYTSVAVDTINTEGDAGRANPEDSTPRPPEDNDESGDNSEPRDENLGRTRGYHCHCHRVTNDGSTNLSNEEQYQTTISMEHDIPESSSANNDLDTPGKPNVEIEVSQLPDLQTQTNVVYTTPIINTQNPISNDNVMTTTVSNRNLGNDVIVNGDDERMKDVLDILNFVQKVEKLMAHHKTPFRIGDRRGGVEIKLQKIYRPDKKQSIQILEDGSAGRPSNDLPAQPIDTVAIHQTAKDSPDSSPLKTKSEEDSAPRSPSDEIEENRDPASDSADVGNSQKILDTSYDRLKKHKEYEHVDEFETYIEGPPANSPTGGKPERNENSPAEKRKHDEERIAPSDQSSPLGGEATYARRRKRPRWKKRRRGPKGRRNRTPIGRRRLFSAQQRGRENDFAFRSAEEVEERRADKSTAHRRYARCSSEKRKKPSVPKGSET